MIYKVFVMFYVIFSLIYSFNCATSSQTGYASYYGKKGERTASGIPLNPKALTAAHKTLPFGSIVKVISLSGKRKSVTVKITDRGPYVKGRIIDLTPAAFARIAPLKKGVVKVKIKVLKLGKNKRRRHRHNRKRKRRKKRRKPRKRRKINAFGTSSPFNK